MTEKQALMRLMKELYTKEHTLYNVESSGGRILVVSIEPIVADTLYNYGWLEWRHSIVGTRCVITIEYSKVEELAKMFERYSACQRL